MAQFAIDEILTTGIAISGFVFDVSNNIGVNGYVLTSTSSGVMWQQDSSNADLSSLSGQIAATGSLLNNRINSLSGYVNGSFISGSGIQNYVPRWNTAKELITGSIYDLGTGVGIGTTRPAAKLEVKGADDALITTIFQSFAGGNTGYNGGIQLGNAVANQNSQIYHSSAGDNTLTFVSNYAGGTANKFIFAPGGTETVRFQQNGRVGIGNAAPATLLSVGGAGSTSATSGITFGADSQANLYRISSSRIKTDGNFTIDGQGGGATSLVLNRSSTSSENGMAFNTAGSTDWYFYVNDSSNNLQIQRSSEIDSAPRVRFDGANSNILFNLGGGNVGIGIDAPSGKLHVVSSIAGETVLRADGTNGTLFSVTDDLSDSLMSVNNSAGLPVFEVFADDRVIAGQYGSGDFVLKNNKVGIGVTNPGEKLDVNGNVRIGLTTTNTIGTSNVFSLQTQAINIQPNSSTDTLYIRGLSAGNYQLQTVTASANGGNLHLQPYGGNVGIGITNPSSKLYISGGTIPLNNRAVFINADITTNTSAYTHTLNLIDTTNDSNTTSFALGSYSHAVLRNRAELAGGAGGILDIYTRVISGDPTVKMTITSDGKVGIGTTNPFHLLNLSTTTSDTSIGLYTTTANTNGRNWLISANDLAYGDFSLRQSLAINGNPRIAGISRFYINNDGNVGIGTTVTPLKLNVSGSIYMAAGSGSAISWANDISSQFLKYDSVTDGMVLSSWSHTTFLTQQTERVRISSNGRVGIGFQTPTELLDVSGRIRAIGEAFTLNAATLTDSQTSIALSRLGAVADQKYWEILSYNAAANGDFAIRTINDAYSVGIDGLRIVRGASYNISSVLLPNGNIGIGTTSPASLINGNPIYFRPNPNAKILDIYSNTNEADINLISNNSGDGSGIGGIYFTRARGQTDAHLQVAAIKAIQGGTNGLLAGGKLYFYTKSNGGGTLETSPAMAIDTAGNIGIGVTAPASKVQISGVGQTIMRLDSDTLTNVSQFQIKAASQGVLVAGMYGPNPVAGTVFGANTSGAAYLGTTTLGTVHPTLLAIGNTSTIPILFGTNNTERMRIDSAGNVGIGITAPVQKFQVDGTVGNPALGGTTQTGIVRISNTTDNATLDFGMRAAGAGAWIQSTDETDLSVYYPLLLNPNGGNVGVGTISALTVLDVRYKNTNNAASQVAGMTLRTNQNGGLEWHLNQTSTSYVGWVAAARVNSYGGNWGQGYLEFITAGAGGNISSTMTLNSGYVGIGITNPTTLLSIGGLGAASAASGITFGQDAQANLYRSAEDTIKTDGSLIINGNLNTNLATVSALNINAGTLGASPVNIALTGFTYAVNNGNISQINFVEKRFATGGDWTTATTRIQKRVDITDQAYIEFNPSGALYGMALGVAAGGSLEAMRILSNGRIGIGTTNPSAKLSLNKGSKDQFLALDIANNDQKYALYVDQDNNGSNSFSVWDATNSHTAIRYLPSSAGYWQLYTNNIERVRIDNAGNVGVGTTNMVGKLDVYDNTDGPLLSFVRNASAGSSAYSAFVLRRDGNNNGIVLFTNSSARSTDGGAGNSTIRTDYGNLNFGAGGSQHILTTGGNVGINNTSPSSKLHVVETTPTGTRIQLGTNTENASMNAGLTNDLLILNAPYGTNSATVPNSGAKWGIKFVGTLEANQFNSTRKTSAIYAVSEDPTAGYNRGTSLAFYTNAWFDQEYTERMRIFHNGNIGIGTTQPSYKLQIVGSGTPASPTVLQVAGLNDAGGDAKLIVSQNPGASDLQLLVAGTDVRADGFTANDQYILAGQQLNLFNRGNGSTYNTQIMIGRDGGYGNISFSTAPQNQTAVVRMYIASGGNVGIGTITPSKLLHVHGDSGEILRLSMPSNYTAGAGPQLSFWHRGDEELASIRGVFNETTQGNRANLLFGTRTSDTLGVETKMTILHNGNVGIGNTIPTGLLNVIRNSNTAQPIAFFKELFGTPPATNILLLERGNNLTAANQLSSNAGLRIRDHLANYSLSVEDQNSNVNFAISGAKVMINSRGTSSLLNIGGAGSTAATSGITFGEDAVTNLYRLSASVLKTDAAFTAASLSSSSYVYAATYLQTAGGQIYAGAPYGTLTVFVGNIAQNAWEAGLYVGRGSYVGIGTVQPSGKLHVVSTVAGETVLRADGTNGTLFSVTDDLSDSLMSVNNSAGLPVLEVFADDRVVAGQYGSGDFVIRNNKVGIGTTNPSYKLDINGSLGINASTSDTNWPFVVSDNSSAGSRYGLNKAGSMGFNHADAYAQLQLVGTNGAYLDLTNSVGGDSNARIIYYTNNRLDLTYGFINKGTISLNSNGVGIGTTNPVWALDVSGTAIRSFASGAVEPGFIVDYASSNGYGGLFIHTNGARKWRIGNVGDTDATNPALFIWQEGVGARMYFRNNGYIGVGTTTVDNKLSVSVPSDSALGNSADGLRITDGTKFCALFRHGTGYNYAGLAGSGSMLYSYDRMAIIADTSNPISFHAGGTERARVLSNGNVGIGTTDPQYKLDVYSAIQDTARFYNNQTSFGLILGSTNNSLYTNLVWTTSNGNAQFFKNASNAGWGGTNSMNLYTSNGAIAFHPAGTQNAVFFNTNGNVGINTTSPNEKLEVQGNIQVGNDSITNVGLKLTRLNGGMRTSEHTYHSSQNSPWYTYGQNLTWTNELAGNVESTQAYRPYFEGFAPAAGYKTFGFMNVTAGAFTSANVINSLVLRNDGNVGIGLTVPTDKIQISGGGISFTSSTGLAIPMLGVTATNVAYVGPYTTTAEGVSPSLVLFNQGASVQQTWFYSSGRVAMVLNKEGRLHIGNTNNTPNCLLSVGPSSSTTAVSGMCFGNDAQANLYRSAEDTIKTDGNLVVAGTTSLNGHIYGQKTVALSTASWTTVLTVNMLSHNSCYVKIGAFGDWSNHSAIAFVSELFIQNGDNAYNTPGTIITAHDNTAGAAGDKVDIQIVDPAAAGTQNFLIQLKLISATSSTNSSLITYHVMGQQASVT